MARGIWCAVLVASFWACGSEDTQPTSVGASGDAGQSSAVGGQESTTAGTGTKPTAGAPDAQGGASAEAGGNSLSAGQATVGETGSGGAAGAAGAAACDPNDCQNGGDCTSRAAGGCACPDAFTGSHCELPRFETAKLPVSSTGSRGVGLSADGSVAVGNTGTAQQQAGFRWTHEGGVLLLDALPSQTNSSVTGVSADGQVVIGRSGAMSEAVYWPASKATPLTLVDAAWESLQAAFVSADGSVIAGNGTLTGGKVSAFRWTKAGGAVSLGDFASTNVNVVGMSADGSIIIGNAGNASTTGFIWNGGAAGNKLTQLTKLAGDDRTDVLAISADGSRVVGDSIQTGGTSRRVRWTGKAQPVLLDPLDPGTAWGCGGGPFTTCTGLSTDGSVIYTQRGTVAQIWTEAGGLRALSVLATKFNCVIMPPQSPLLGGVAGSCVGPPTAVVWDDKGAVSRVDDVLETFGVTAPAITSSNFSGVRAVSANGDTLLGDDFTAAVWIARIGRPAK